MKNEINKKITGKSIWCAIEKTVQVRPYEPVKVLAGMSGDLHDKTGADDAFDEMFSFLEDTINYQLKDLIDD